MNSRRSFLRILGLSAVAAPVVAKAVQAEAVPVNAISINDRPWRVLAAQCCDGSHTHTYSGSADPSHTHTISSDSDDMRRYIAWRQKLLAGLT
jgi:hypothetical protein